MAQSRIREQLSTVIPNIEHFEVDDAGSAGSGAMIKLLLVSSTFDGLGSLKRQQLVFTAFERELASGAIHSIPQLQALTPAEWNSSRTSTCSNSAFDPLAVLQQRIRAAMPIEHLEVLDVTNGHAVDGFHDGSKRALDPNGLELELKIVSSAFEGKRLLERQQMIQHALGPELLSGAIHALPRIKVLTPAQWKAANALHGNSGAAPVNCDEKESDKITAGAACACSV